MFFCSCGNLWEHADHRGKWPGQCSRGSGLARAAAWYHSQITSGWLANIYCMTPSSVLPFISCELWEAILSIAQILINPYRLFFHWTVWRTFTSSTRSCPSFAQSSTAPKALRRKVQYNLSSSTRAAAWPQTLLLTETECTIDSPAILLQLHPSLTHTLHI